jgi:hypothetical protein
VREGVNNDSKLKHFHTFRFFKINSRLVLSSVCEDSDALKIGEIYDHVQKFADAGFGLVNLEIN